jgi:ribosome-binding factor A
VPSRRMEKVAALLKEEISIIITQTLNDPRLGFVTVTEVRVQSDLSLAQVYVTVLGDEKSQQETMTALHRARKHIQTVTSERVALRRFPELTFHPDDRVKNSLRISRLLSELATERQSRETEGTETSEQ